MGYSISVGAPVCSYTQSTGPTPEVLASPTSAKIKVDGKELALDGYMINSNNYFKLRDRAQIVSGSNTQFEVTWSEAKSAIELFSKKPYTATGGDRGKTLRVLLVILLYHVK